MDMISFNESVWTRVYPFPFCCQVTLIWWCARSAWLEWRCWLIVMVLITIVMDCISFPVVPRLQWQGDVLLLWGWALWLEWRRWCVEDPCQSVPHLSPRHQSEGAGVHRPVGHYWGNFLYYVLCHTTHLSQGIQHPVCQYWGNFLYCLTCHTTHLSAHH